MNNEEMVRAAIIEILEQSELGPKELGALIELDKMIPTGPIYEQLLREEDNDEEDYVEDLRWKDAERRIFEKAKK